MRSFDVEKEILGEGASPAGGIKGIAPPIFIFALPDFQFCPPPPPDLFLAFQLCFLLKLSIALTVKIVAILTVSSPIWTSILFD